jgi:hypothetical protein
MKVLWKMTRKKVKILVGRYVSLKAHSSEMFSGHAERGEWGQRKDRSDWVTRNLWNIFPAKFLSNNQLHNI